MRLSEKYSWLNWRTVHWIALGCILAGFVFAGLGVLLVGLDSHNWHDLLAHFDIAGFNGTDAPAAPSAPEPPTPPSPPTLS